MLEGISRAATYYYHPDHLGSVSVVSNHKGEPYERVEYLPFGEIWIEDTDPATSYIPFRFTSKELDEETGLYYYGARYYEPKMSRWMSADPAGWELINPMEPDGEPVPDGWPEGFGPGPSMGMRPGYSVIEATNWYSYVSNNPVLYVDPTGMEKEKLEQIGRTVAIAASAVEVGVGAALVAGGVTSPVGAFMIAHGGANLAAATASTIAYETTDGNTEISTSALGLVAQGVSYLSLRIDGVDKGIASDRSAMAGSVADTVDGAVSLAVKAPGIVAKSVAKLSGLVNLGGDLSMVGATAQDWASNASERNAEARRKPELQ